MRAARQAGLYVEKVGSIYVVATTKKDAAKFLWHKYEELLRAVHEEVKGCLSRKCCVKLRQVVARLIKRPEEDAATSLYVSFYVSLVKRYALQCVVVEEGKTTRVCLLRSSSPS